MHSPLQCEAQGFPARPWTQEACSTPLWVCAALRELPMYELGDWAFRPWDPQNHINLHTFPRTDLSQL